MSNYESSISREKIKFDKIININIDYFEQLCKPIDLIAHLPVSFISKETVFQSRININNIINGNDDRMIFIVGPCSIHNVYEAKEYGNKLKILADRVNDKILIVMRVYFEKPRTTIGWKGLINDPNLDKSFDVNKGLYNARELLISLNLKGLPCAYEILDTITPQYISDLISWGAIGARTTESQVHRQLVSGLSMPVGFKNGTDGNIKIASDAILSAQFPHCFMGITGEGVAAICKTKGNKNCHVVLRGGSDSPNYYKSNVDGIISELSSRGINSRILIDCSHGNSRKDFKNQEGVLKEVIKQRVNGNKNIIGVMIESNINEGAQILDMDCKRKLKTGVSITDSCISFETTDRIIMEAYKLLP